MTDPQPSAGNAAQIDFWNTGAGETWAELQTLLDRQISPLGLQAMRALGLTAGEQVLDIGCGCGQTSLQLAERVGPSGHVLGVDISQPMLEVARRRAAEAAAGSVAFRQADAQAADLGAGAFDVVYSRFGVMFFADPPAAFANIRTALKPGGRMAFVCWRSPAENPLMVAPMVAAMPFLPPMPPPDPLEPGPFAFADSERVRSILGQAGFADIAVEPFDALVGAGGLEDSLSVAFRIGPLGRVLREHPDRREAVVDAVRAALTPYVTDDGLKMAAAVWIVTARKG